MNKDTLFLISFLILSSWLLPYSTVFEVQVSKERDIRACHSGTENWQTIYCPRTAVYHLITYRSIAKLVTKKTKRKKTKWWQLATKILQAFTGYNSANCAMFNSGHHHFFTFSDHMITQIKSARLSNHFGQK